MAKGRSTAVKYLRSTKGKTVVLALCLVCTVLLVVAFAALKPTVIDLWHRHQLRSSDSDVRARAVEAVCSNPSPMAVRELVLMFSREDEAANIDVLATGGLPLLSHVLTSVREEATWFLGSVPRVEENDQVHSCWEDNDLVKLRHTMGSEYFLEKANLKRPGEPSLERLNTLFRSTEVISRILKATRS